ncbi:winged helix-turn-helix domain-containing protein [Streptomyces sp. NPDC048516]|uniref:helix-turn-helix domain-containing protein n=1 Tax=Streptomyces sp. NPDC048516 TaxID=3365565 RepID=UPI0037226501
MPSRNDGSEYIVHDVHTSCQLSDAETGDSPRISLPGQCNQGPAAALRVAPSHQWVSTTTGRITDGHDWLMAVHWAADPKHKRYTPSSAHGPRSMNDTTLRLARTLAHLTECRPGIAFLMRLLKASERTVEYHLGMLREAGLLAYRSKGTRVSGVGAQASVYERVVPFAYDEAHGIRTVGEGPARRIVGAAPEHRDELGKLSKKAARKTRRTRRTRKGRCTPMQGGTSGSSSAGTSTYPPENKLASGTSDSPTPQIPKQRARRALNRVGRRYQLAQELIQTIPWLGNTNTARVAWVAREVADAGWSADETRAYLDQFALGPADGMRRPTGVLARRLKGATRILRTPQARQECLNAWRESRQATRAEHDATQYETFGPGPSSAHVQELVAEAFRRTQPRPATDEECIGEYSADSPIVALEDLTRDEVIDMRAAAAKDPSVIGLAIDLIGEHQARRLYTNAAVNRNQAEQETAHA